MRTFTVCSNIGVKEFIAMKPIGTFGRLFILINRLFGGMCVIGGIAMVLTALGQAITRGASITSFWQTLGIGVCIIAAGVLYLRAPLFRDTGAKSQECDPLKDLNEVDRAFRQEADREP
jgi:hypothetical protein